MGWALVDGEVLAIFARRPDRGRVKSRLTPALGEDGAARLYEAMLLDQLDFWGGDTFLQGGGRRVIVFDPPDAGPWFDERVSPRFALQPQTPGELGARMAGFTEGEFEEGARKIVLIGSDSPTLDPNFVASAFLMLDHREVVLGPSTDGGYYLIGLARPASGAFADVAWGSASVLGQTIHRLNDLDIVPALLPPWYDVDHPEDLYTLTGHLRAMEAAGMPRNLPRTEALLFGEGGRTT